MPASTLTWTRWPTPPCDGSAGSIWLATTPGWCAIATWEQRPETWRWLIDVKLMGVRCTGRGIRSAAVAQGSGHFLNTASAGGLMPLPKLSPYNATMHAVVGVTETLNIELRSVSPRLVATVLCPGLVETALRGTNSTALAPPAAAAAVGDPGGDTSRGLRSIRCKNNATQRA